MRYNLLIGDQKYEVEVGEIFGDAVTVQVNGAPYEVVIENHAELGLSAPSPQPVTTPTPAAAPARWRTRRRRARPTSTST